MLEGHISGGGTMTVAEVRYETMRMGLRIAEAELVSARAAEELAGAWAHVEAQAGLALEALEEGEGG